MLRKVRFTVAAAFCAAGCFALPAQAQSFNQALQLGPGHGYVAIPANSALDFTTGFTAEAWVSAVDALDGGCSSILGKDYTQAFWVGICGTIFRTYIKGAGSSFDAGTVPVDQWTHVAVTYDGVTRRHYVNGILRGQDEVAPPMTSSTSGLRIGSDTNWQHTPIGFVDEVRLWNVARSITELQRTMYTPLMSAPPGLVALYRFNGDAGDLTGAHDGTLNLAAVIATPPVSILSRPPDVVEFYNTTLDNYFITADRTEAAAVDGGAAGPGWGRTGNLFTSGGSTPVCRFYGSITPGPNSHFYTLNEAECNGLKALQQSTPASEPRWNFESLDFLSTPPTGEACPAGTVPVYRAYNNSLSRHVDSNHRITSSPAGIDEVVARGWISEGVVMCAPAS
jgi:hypothetical protein